MQVWPQSAWFGLTHRRLRMFQFCILFLLAGVLLLLLLTIGYARYRAHVAKQLSVRVQALTIGKPPPPEVIAQLKQHQTKIHFGEEKPCTPQDCVYVAAISTFGLSNFEGYGVLPQEFAWSVLGALDNETLRYMGIRHWIVGASVGVADGRVAWYSGDVFVEGPQHKWLDTSWHVAPAMPERVVRVYESTSMDLSSCAYLVDWHHLHMGGETGEGLYANLTTNATLEERREMFNINWGCLTKLGGCATLSELVPDQARYDRQHCAKRRK